MQVTLFTEASRGPGSGSSCRGVVSSLMARGFDCRVIDAHDAHMERCGDVLGRPLASLCDFAGHLRRTASLVASRRCDVIVLHRPFAAMGGLPESLLRLRGVPMVLDFDDAIHLSPSGRAHPFRAAAVRRLLSVVDHVVARNEYLAGMVGAPHKTSIIPVAVDTQAYVPGPPNTSPWLVFGWIGESSDFPHLEPVMPQLLRAVEQLPHARLRIVSNGVMPAYEAHPLVEHWRWHRARELQALQSFDVGVLPLLDSATGRGKSGFGLLQHMAAGVPVVASAVGAHASLLGAGDAGVLVPPGGDWVRPLLTLGASAQLRAAAGLAARQRVVEHHSVDSVIDSYLTLFGSLARQ